ncbi:MAG: rRNA maturation RNase YbeY [Oscillospiraceae bacterium]|nr:rRNA maturation RNase YbeY [Oscillospiraceae bacterium]
MKIYIFLSDEQDKIPIPEYAERLIEDCTREALSEEEIDEDAEVSVTFVDNERIRELNAEFREIDRETDVLSFPIGDEEGFEVDPDNDAIILGDIVISLEKAREQAEEYSHSFKRELAFLITHSLFHLMGYDHVNGGEEERIMFSKQERVLERLGITRGEGQ